jgi:hypothetical protein
MIAAWMVYCSLCALALACAADLAERVLLAGRGPVRLVWVAAIALSLLVPAAAFRFARRSAGAGAGASLSRGAVSDAVLDTAFGPPALGATPAAAQAVSSDWRATARVRVSNLQRSAAPFDTLLVLAWFALSLLVALNVAGGMLALAWLRRSWKRRIVLGVPVFVAERVGPAVVGALSPAIVVPEWVLGLQPAHLALMLRHEEEHRRAGDRQLLTVAQLALIAMPWNVALLWQMVRLRMAVELDCDARVLRDADPRSYGDLLLEVARPRRGAGLIGATAFAERATQLERRIRVLGRHRARTSRVARSAAVCIGLAAVTAAWAAPRPPVAGSARPKPSITVPSPSRTRAVAPVVSPKPAIRTKTLSGSDGVPQVALPARPIAASAVIAGAAAPCAQTSEQGRTPSLDSIFALLFDGIALAANQRAAACELLAQLQQQQFAADETAAAASLGIAERARALQARRDTALRALLTNDVDRVAFDVRAALSGTGGGAGGRGRSGGPRPDLAGGGRVGGARERGALIADTVVYSMVARGRAVGDTIIYGRGGRGGEVRPGAVSFGELPAAVASQMANLTFQRLFDGIALTPAQEAVARTLIVETQQQILAQTMLRPIWLRVNSRTRLVAMRPSSASALLALVFNDADRATLQSRIRNIP